MEHSMTALLVHPSMPARHRADRVDSGAGPRAGIGAGVGAGSSTRSIRLRTRHRRSLGIREAWRLLSDDLPEFGDDD
jgi:hypothetical protein